MKKMNGKVIEWELEESGFGNFDASAVRRALNKWEEDRNGGVPLVRFNFKFGKENKNDKRKSNQGT